nr:hypothetical protein CFP56_18108 [Quercus suber]
MGEMNIVRFVSACPSYTKLAWLTNNTQELQGTSKDTTTIVVVVTVAAIATTHRNYKGHRGTPSPLLPLQPRNRLVRKTHASPIVAWNLLCAALGETNTVRVAIDCSR